MANGSSRNIENDTAALNEFNRLLKESNLTAAQGVSIFKEMSEARKVALDLEKEIESVVSGRYGDEIAKEELLKIAREERKKSLETYKTAYQKIQEIEAKREGTNKQLTKEDEEQLLILKKILEEERNNLKIVDEQVKAAYRLNLQLEVQRNFFKEISGIIKRGFADALGLGDVYQNMNKGFLASQAFALQYAKSTMEMLQTVNKSNVEFTRMTGQEIDRTMGTFGMGMSRFGLGYKQMSESMGKLFVSMSGFSKLSKEQQDQLTASAAKLSLLGISAETTGKNINTLTKTFGYSIKQAEKLNEDLARAAIGAGIPPKKMADEFEANMPRLAAYGKQAYDVYVDLQKQAKSLGMEISALSGIIGEQWDTFEGSARAAGRLNALLGGPFLNSVEMLNAKDNERLLILKRSLDASGKNFENLTQHEQRAYAAALGIKDINEATKLFTKSTYELTMDMQAQQASQEKLEKAQKSAAETTDKMKELFNSFLIIIKPIVKVISSIVEALTEFADKGNGAGGVLLGLFTIIMAWQQTKAVFLMVGGGFRLILTNISSIGSTLATAGRSFLSFFGIMSSGAKAAADATSAAASTAKTVADTGSAAQTAAAAGNTAGNLSNAQQTMSRAPNASAGIGFRMFMRNLRLGIQEFATNPGRTLTAIVVLGLSIVGLSFALSIAIGFFEKLKLDDVLTFGLTLFALAYGIKRMSEVDIKLSRVMMFTAATLMLGLGLLAISASFLIFSQMDWKKVLAGLLLLGGAVALAIGIGAILTNPVALAFFELGILYIGELAIVLGVFGLALLAIGGGLKLSASAFKDFDTVVSTLPDNLSKLNLSFDAITVAMMNFSGLETDFSKPINSIKTINSAINEINDAKIQALNTLATTLQTFSSFSDMTVFDGIANGIKLIGEAINTLPNDKTVTLSTINETLNTVKSLKKEDLEPAKQFVDIASAYFEAQKQSKDSEKDALVQALKEVLGTKENKSGGDSSQEGKPMRIVLESGGRDFAAHLISSVKQKEILKSRR